MSNASFKDRIIAELSTWPGIIVAPGDFPDETAFVLGERELGHLHGSRAAHLFFSKQTWHQLRDQDRVGPHPVFPRAQGPAQRLIRNAEDAEDVIALFRIAYDAVLERHEQPPKAA
jgi:hypothetical protein